MLARVSAHRHYRYAPVVTMRIGAGDWRTYSGRVGAGIAATLGRLDRCLASRVRSSRSCMRSRVSLPDQYPTVPLPARERLSPSAPAGILRACFESEPTWLPCIARSQRRHPLQRPRNYRRRHSLCQVHRPDKGCGIRLWSPFKFPKRHSVCISRNC